MISIILRLLAILSIANLFSSCGSLPAVDRRTANASLAKEVLDHPKITLMRKQISGRVDSASSYHNIASVANGYRASRSNYGRAPGGYTKLRRKMLTTMLYLADRKGYSYRVTSIAGGSHSRKSRHYAGIAFDVDMINGRKVGYGNPYYKAFVRAAKRKGATECLGPGDRNHSRHVHLAWPR
jgi:hypothetical protein